MIKYFIYRFPIFLLIFTTLAIIISVISVFQLDYNFKYILLYLLTWLSFLFHIRVVDDYRDFDHDTKYYSERELQKWKINIKNLFISAEIIIIIILILNYYYLWIVPILIMILWWLNSLASINYFWYWKKIEKNYMILYHIINNFTLNTFFIYLYFNIWVFEINNYFLIIIHLIFLNLLVFLLEITRKIKSKDDKNIWDKYIDKYWYKKNFYIISFVSIFIFWIMNYFFYILNINLFTYILYFISFSILFIVNILHFKYKTKNYKNLILLFSLIFYLFSGFYFFEYMVPF